MEKSLFIGLVAGIVSVFLVRFIPKRLQNILFFAVGLVIGIAFIFFYRNYSFTAC